MKVPVERSSDPTGLRADDRDTGDGSDDDERQLGESLHGKHG